MMKKDDRAYKGLDLDFGEVHLTGGFVCRGTPADLSRFFEEIGEIKPGSIKIVYQRYSPGRLILKAEGER